MKRMLAKGLLAFCGTLLMLVGVAQAGHPHHGCRVPPPPVCAPRHHHHHHANYAYYGGGRTVVYRPAPAVIVPYGSSNFGPGASFGFFFSSP